MAKKRTQAQTPAPPKDRIKGSKKNPEGSASGSRGSIKISDKTEKALVNLRNKHNDKYKSPSKRVDLGMLKAVYRRGAGAFSVSHRPNVSSREQWALARVKAFLKLVGTGERKKAYNTDLDLLPKGHPQKSEAKSEAVALAPKKYSHISFKPPQGAQTAAARALKKRAEKPPSQRGMTSVGLARARDLANGRELSPETVRRMLAYFTRHEVDKQGSTWDEYGKGRQAWDGWGGDAGFAFARKVVKQMNAADNKTTLRAYGEAIQLSESNAYEVPEGLTIGKPFKTLSLGQVSSRMSGDAIGKEIDQNLISELVRVFKERREHDPVIIDWQHATSPFQGGTPAPPESGSALGMIIDLEMRDDGLYAIPAYNERGMEVVKNAGGVLWSSPEYIHGEIFSRDGGDKVGDAQLLAITLTPRPAQSHNKIDRITLSEESMMEDQINELKVALEAKDAMVKELEAKIREMMDDKDSSLTEEEKMAEHDDKEKMAEHDDAEEKKEHYDEEKQKMMEDEEEKKQKLSETFTQDVSLLNEVVALRESVKKLEAENNKIKCDEAVSSLLREGKISPAEQDVASKAWNIKDLQPEFWQMFSERQSNSSVPLEEVGHGASGQEISKKSLDQKVRALAEEKSINYSEALSLFRESNPDFYRQAFGG
jgi:phage I-like protein